MSTISVTDPNLAWSPYTWHIANGKAKTINAGARVRAFLTGSLDGLTVTFDTTYQSTPKTRVGIRIDNGPWQDFDVAPTISPALAANSWQARGHMVEVVMVSHSGNDRWSSPQNTAMVLTGISASGAIATRPIKPYPLRGLAIGDSMCEGVGTVANAADGAAATINDSRYSWAYPLIGLLGADIGIVGFNGAALSHAAYGTLPKFPASVPYLWAGQSRDITTSEPDFVIANVGTNDNINNNPPETVTADTTALMNYLLGATVNTRIIVVPGWRRWGNDKSAAILAGINASSDPNRITFVPANNIGGLPIVNGNETVGPDCGDGLHPYGYINQAVLSPYLANEIRDALSLEPASSGEEYIFDVNLSPIPLD